MLLNTTSHTLVGVINHPVAINDLAGDWHPDRQIEYLVSLYKSFGCNGVIIPEPYAPIICLLLQLEGIDVFQLLNNKIVEMAYLPAIAKYPEAFK